MAENSARFFATAQMLGTFGIHQIDTVEQAAMDLKPLAGNMAYLLCNRRHWHRSYRNSCIKRFPSYIFTEAFGWEQGLDKKFHEAAVPVLNEMLASSARCFWLPANA